MMDPDPQSFVALIPDLQTGLHQASLKPTPRSTTRGRKDYETPTTARSDP